MVEDIVIAGTSGFAKEIEWLIERVNKSQPKYRFLGFVGQDEDDRDINLFGSDEDIIRADSKLNVVIAIANPEVRRKLHSSYAKNPNIIFPNIIDPSVLFSSTVFCGLGNIICAGPIFTIDIQIGNFNIINLDCTIGHEVSISDYVTLSPSVNISGNVALNSGVSVGTGSQIIPGLEIGENTQVGAGAVVVCNLPSNCTAVGVPAKVVRMGD